MEPRYESGLRSVDRSSRRRATLASVVAMALLGLVIARPWGSAPATDTSPTAPSVAPSVVSGQRPAPSVRSVAIEVPSWPVVPSHPRALSVTSGDAERLLRPPADRSAEWSVADAGARPRLADDGSWVDWLAVPVAPATDAPGTVVMWPGTGLCTDLPVLQGGPSFIAVSAPDRVARVPHLTGWWSDGTRVASLDGSVRQVVGSTGLGVLERLDGSRWPSGRYEFHVSIGARTLAMTVCLAG